MNRIIYIEIWFISNFFFLRLGPFLKFLFLLTSLFWIKYFVLWRGRRTFAAVVRYNIYSALVSDKKSVPTCPSASWNDEYRRFSHHCAVVTKSPSYSVSMNISRFPVGRIKIYIFNSSMFPWGKIRLKKLFI